MIQLLIVAAVRLYREGLSNALGSEPDIRVVGTAATHSRALELVSELRPDVTLLDLDPTVGCELVRLACEATPGTRVVALAVPDGEDHLIAWAEAGIAGYVDREAPLERLLETIRAVARGETPVSPRVAAMLFRRVASLAAEHEVTSAGRLTTREGEILSLISRGWSNKEIADHLTIELPTVKNHVHNILEKMHVQRRGEAAARWRGR